MLKEINISQEEIDRIVQNQFKVLKMMKCDSYYCYCPKGKPGELGHFLQEASND